MSVQTDKTDIIVRSSNLSLHYYHEVASAELRAQHM
jgi:hypothetical protein